jgi:hypothetical protein
MADWISTLALAMGSSWLSGVNLYATVGTLGLLQRFGMARLPGDMSYLGEWWVIALALSLYAIEFVADKVPFVDNIWDAVHTFIRVPAGAALAAAAFADADPAVRTAALLLGGGVALGSHGAKAAVRLAANASPEPFSNIALSLVEDGFAVGLSIVMVFFPLVALGALAVFLAVAIWSAPKILRAIRRLFARGSPSAKVA